MLLVFHTRGVAVAIDFSLCEATWPQRHLNVLLLLAGGEGPQWLVAVSS